MTYALWVIQGLLALLFLFAGGMKLILPVEEMTKQMPVPLPGLFLRFIAVVEVLGALGLILPGLLRIRPGLTPLAAAGLVIIMIGATMVTLASRQTPADEDKAAMMRGNSEFLGQMLEASLQRLEIVLGAG